MFWISAADMRRGFRSEMLLLILSMSTALASAGKDWSKAHHQHHHGDHSNNVDVSGRKSHLQRLEVVCSRDHMTVHMHFDEPFYGVVFSHGTPRHERCVHVGPRAGITSASFDIRYDSCGTVEDLSGRFHENTLVVQFDEDILEAWDEAKRLRCEWLESFEKQSSKPTLAISDLDVVELNFQGDDIDCWMEVQEGKGPWARQVGGLVPIGSPLTLVIAINDHSREFDMRVKRCSASDGKGEEIELTDVDGCVLRPSLLTPFAKIRDFGGRATLVAYSHLYAFKFPDKMDVFVHCIVEVCRHGCVDTCTHHHHQSSSSYLHHHQGLESKKIEKLASLAAGGVFHGPSKNSRPFPAVAKNGEQLISSAQTQIQHHVSRKSNYSTSSSVTSLVNRDEQRATFKPPPRVVHKELPKSPAVSSASGKVHGPLSNEHGASSSVHGASSNVHSASSSVHGASSNVHSASSNVHGIFVDVENNLHQQNAKLASHKEVGPSSAPTAHRIIGHDVHWIDPEAVKHSEDRHLSNHHVSSLKDISHLPPQPEPAAWSADEVRPLSRDEAFHSRATPNPLFDAGVQAYHGNVPYVTKMQWAPNEQDVNKPSVVHSVLPKKEVIPQPEPAAWSYEEVNPMHRPGAVEHLQLQAKPEEPRPEPSSTWTFDDVKGLSKENLRVLSLNHKMKSHGPPVYKELVHPQYDSTSTTVLPQPIYVSRYTLGPLNTTGLHPNPMKNMMMMMMPTMLPLTYQTAHWPQRTTTSRYLRPLRHHYPYPVPQFSPHQRLMMSVIGDRRMDSDEDSLELSLHHNLEPRQKIRIGETAGGVMTSSELDAGVAGGSAELRHVLFDSLDDDTELRTGTKPGTSFDSEVVTGTTPEHLGREMTGASGSSESNVSLEGGEAFEKMTSAAETSAESRVVLLEADRAEESQTLEDVVTEITAAQLADSVASDKPANKITTTIGGGQPPLSEGEQTAKWSGASAERPAISGFVPPSLDAVGSNPELDGDRPVPGPRSLEHRRKKRSSEPVFGVRQKFQAIAPSDLAFDWNLTSEGYAATLLRGHVVESSEIVYGICMSPVGMGAGVGFILVLTLLSTMASVVLYEHSCKLAHKTSQLAFLTKNFNGQFETLYRITRPYLYPDNGNTFR